MSRKVSLVMIVVGGVIAGFGACSGSLAVAIPMIIVGYGLLLVGLLVPKTDK